MHHRQARPVAPSAGGAACMFRALRRTTPTPVPRPCVSYACDETWHTYAICMPMENDMPTTAHRRSAPRGVPKRTLAILGMLSIFAPISLDLYLPRLPQLADDLGTSASAAQLSLTTCMLGLALGQVIAGTASDRFGRRFPLMVGLAAYVAASALCALAPSISVLLLVCFIQGVAGAAGIMIAQAVGRDRY